MKQRSITALVYVIVIVGLLALKWAFPEYGSIGFDVLFWAISVIGAFEFMRAVKEISKAQWWTVMITCALIVPSFVVAKMLVSYYSTPDKGSEFALMTLMTVASVGSMVTASLMIFDVERSNLKSTAYAIFCIIYCGVLGCVGANINHMVTNSFPAILLLFALTACVDTFAFLIGKFFGRFIPLKLAPHTSPNKTVVGAVGGVIGGIVAAVIVYFICVALPVSPYSPAGYVIFDYTGDLHPCGMLILIAIPTSIFAQLGDLFESAIKRGCGVKDMGKLLPGHGGMLDRFDSMLFAAVAIVVMFIMVR
jgi:phosphatidate cytidylyltransferase